MEEVSVSVYKISMEELSSIYAKGCNMITEIPKYVNVFLRHDSEKNGEKF
jgi:hypothetical protein